MNEKTKERFTSPQHLGYLQDGQVGEAGNPLCGDVVTMTVRISDNVVEDVKFQSAGCIYSFVCAETAASMAIGKSLYEAVRLAPEAVEDALGGLPDGKLHCAKMACDALKNAIMSKSVEKKPLLKEKTPRDIRHFIAETFDDFIIPEALAEGVAAKLKGVDCTEKTVSASMPGASPSLKKAAIMAVQRAASGYRLKLV